MKNNESASNFLSVNVTSKWQPSNYILNLESINANIMNTILSTHSTMEKPILVSPYEEKKANRRYKKVYPNRVYIQWYRRYVKTLPESDQLDFQPFEEVQKIDEDIALQHFYGEDGPNLDGYQRDIQEMRRTALEKYHKLKEQEEKEKAILLEELERSQQSRYRSIMKTLKAREGSDFGASAHETKVFMPIIQFLHKMQTKKRRKLRGVVLKPFSKWKILRSVQNVWKLHSMHAKLMIQRAHARFRKIIRLVICSMRFINVIRLIAGSTKQILKEIESFKGQQRDAYLQNKASARKKMFDYTKYTFKELHIPLDTLLTLTKPWFLREDKEIDEVVNMLQAYKSFVQYPPLFQRRLARLAWYIEIEANKYIIRERHIAYDFYVLLKGRVQEVRLVGDPYYHGRSIIEHIRYIRKSAAFGDESMSDPECQRDYSIISREPCALLAISVYDYNVMLHTRKDTEIAPEHIIFISHLKLLEDFPRRKLMEEGDENITIHYFRPESAVTKNLNTSKYVFVVSNGSCQVLAEMVPEKIIQKSGRKRRFKINRPRMEADKLKILTKTKPSRMQSKVDINVIKHELKLQHRRRASLGGVHRAAIAAEIAELRIKAEEIMQTLPKCVRETLSIENFLRMLQSSGHFNKYFNAKSLLMQTQSVHSVVDSLSMEKWSLFTASQLNLAMPGIKTAQSEVCHNQPEKHDMEESASISEKSSFGVLAQTENDAGIISELLNQSISLAKDSDEKVFKEKIKNIKDDKRSIRLSSTIKHDAKYIPDQWATEYKSKSRPSRFKARDDYKMFTRWKHIRHLSRGDYVGQEWLDFNKGPFEKPKEIMSLVSNGCEVIMIKRAFLLKYLRKEW